MARSIVVEVENVPTSGSPVKKRVSVDPQKVTVAEALVAAGVSGKDRDITVDGVPATLETLVAAGQTVRTAPRTPVRVRVEERPAGS